MPDDLAVDDDTYSALAYYEYAIAHTDGMRATTGRSHDYAQRRLGMWQTAHPEDEARLIRRSVTVGAWEEVA